jgi:hypothetical protein
VLTESELREQSEISNQVLSKALRQLLESGAITRSGQGKRGNPYRYSKELDPEQRDISDDLVDSGGTSDSQNSLTQETLQTSSISKESWGLEGVDGDEF